MKNLVTILLIFSTIMVMLSGCAEKNALASEQAVETGTELAKNSVTESSALNSKELDLSVIRKAAEAAGYNVSDGHQLVFMKDVVDGFSVQIIADDKDVIYSIIQCKTEDAAIDNAKAIDEAGYNIAIRSGKILTCYNVDNKNGTIKEILASILAGEPIASK